MKKLKNPLFYITISAICLAACTSKEEKATVGKNYLEDRLTVEQAMRYVKNYEPHAGTIDSVIIDSNGRPVHVKVPNTRAIWFSTERLRSLLDSIDKEKGDGIRFYFATYDKVYMAGKKAPDTVHWGHNTLLMVSTKFKDGLHADYFHDTSAGYKPKGFIVGSPPENRGEMCPPPKYCDIVGAYLIERPKN